MPISSTATTITTVATSGRRSLYTLSVQDFNLSYPASSYLGGQGVYSDSAAAQRWVNSLGAWGGVGFSVPEGVRMTAADLPAGASFAQWRDWRVSHPAVEFHGTYTPAVYDRNSNLTWALRGVESDHTFLGALAAAEAAYAEANPTPGLYLPWVITMPREADYLVNTTETDDEVTPQGSIIPVPGTVKVANDHEYLNRRSCSMCGEIGHNSRTCDGRQPRAYDKIGVEIEGRFHNLRERRREATSVMGSEGTSDGSVHSGGGDLSPWEFRTRPGSLSEQLNQVHQFYPDDTGSDCGMHVHVSFAAADIALLANTAFFTYFRQRWTDWGARMRIRRGTEFWNRLEGRNSYCRVNNEVPRVLEHMDRYHQLNFSSWEDHKTVECRLLPMFKQERLALSAIQELISIYEDWFAMDHADLFPPVEVNMPEYSVTPDVTAYTVEPPSVVFSVSERIPMVDLPSPAPGLVRVAIPTGRTVDNTTVLQRFESIYQESVLMEHRESQAA